MESLDKELLLRDAERFGYQLMRPGVDPGDVLHRMLLSQETRILEGIPVVLTNILFDNSEFDLKGLEKELPNALQKRFRIFCALTYLFLFWVPDGESPRHILQNYLKEREPSIIENITEKFRNQHKIVVGGGIVLDEARLEKTYKNYVVSQFMATQENFSRKLEEQREAMLRDSMRELFTDKQKDLIEKMLHRQELSKTDREYYSRVIKPRLKALRNQDLQTMAATLLGY